MKQEMDERGQYRPIFSRLWDDPDFRKLSRDHKLLFLYLRTCTQCHRAAIYKFNFEACEDDTTLDKDTILDGILILSKMGWVEVEAKIIWIKKGLHFDPGFNPNNENHMKAIKTQVFTLPRLKIVKDFIGFYKFKIPYELPTHTINNTIPNGVKDSIRDQVVDIREEEVDMRYEETDIGKRKEGVQREPSREPIQHPTNTNLAPIRHPTSTNSAPKVNLPSLSKEEKEKTKWLLKEQDAYLKEHGDKDFGRVDWEKYIKTYYSGSKSSEESS